MSGFIALIIAARAEKVRSIGAFLPGAPAIRLILPDGTSEHAVGLLSFRGTWRKFQMEFKLTLEVANFFFFFFYVAKC